MLGDLYAIGVILTFVGVLYFALLVQMKDDQNGNPSSIVFILFGVFTYGVITALFWPIVLPILYLNRDNIADAFRKSDDDARRRAESNNQYKVFVESEVKRKLEKAKIDSSKRSEIGREGSVERAKSEKGRQTREFVEEKVENRVNRLAREQSERWVRQAVEKRAIGQENYEKALAIREEREQAALKEEHTPVRIKAAEQITVTVDKAKSEYLVKSAKEDSSHSETVLANSESIKQSSVEKVKPNATSKAKPAKRPISYLTLLENRLKDRGYTFDGKYAVSPNGVRTYIASSFDLQDLLEEPDS